MNTLERLEKNAFDLSSWTEDQINFLKLIASMSYKDGFNAGQEEWKNQLSEAVNAFTKTFEVKTVCDFEDLDS